MSGSPRKRSVAWKQRERDVAEFHRLVRNPLSGANSGRLGDAYDPDEVEPWVYIECKHYEKHAAITTLDKHEKYVLKKKKKGLCVACLSENRRHGFYLLIHNSNIIDYAVMLLRKHGYIVTKKEDVDAAYDCLRDGENVETNGEDELALRAVSDEDVI